MITITPYQGEFCQKIYTIYSIDECNPNSTFRGSTTTSEICPYCNARNIFRVYEPRREYETDELFGEVYDCKCPNCEKEFEFISEFDKED